MEHSCSFRIGPAIQWLQSLCSMINCINYSRKSDWFSFWFLVDSFLSYTDMIYILFMICLLFPTAWSLELTCFTVNWIGCEFSVKFSVVFQFSCSYICSGVVSVIEYFCYSCFEIKIDLVCSNSKILLQNPKWHYYSPARISNVTFLSLGGSLILAQSEGPMYSILFGWSIPLWTW